MIKFGDAMIVDTPNLQKNVGLSSIETVYDALAKAVRTVEWLWNILLELYVA